MSKQSQKNVLYYLSGYRNNLIQYLNGVTKKNPGKYYANLFTNWYLNSNRKNLVPQSPLYDIDDFKYAKNNFVLLAKPSEMVKECEEIYKVFLKSLKTEKVSKKYRYIPKLFSKKQELRLEKIHIGKGKYENHRNELMEILKFLGGFSNHLSIPPQIFKGDGITELFGTSVNTSYKFCSPFEVDKKFGSLGSFFNLELTSGMYVANPPFNEKIMTKMSNMLISQLEKKGEEIDIIITIPVWDSVSQKKYNLTDYGMPFQGFEILDTSDFLVEKLFLPKYYAYYSYYADKFISASATHLILLSNYETEKSLDVYKSRWK